MRSLIARLTRSLVPALVLPAYHYEAARYNSQRELTAQRAAHAAAHN